MNSFVVTEGHDVDVDGKVYHGGEVVELEETDERTVALVTNGYIVKKVENPVNQTEPSTDQATDQAPAESEAPAEESSTDAPAE